MERPELSDISQNPSRLIRYWDGSKRLEEKLFKITLRLLPHTLTARAFSFIAGKSIALKWYLEDKREIPRLRNIQKPPG